MTVIAYRDGIMAADRNLWDSAGHIVGALDKITRLPDGGLIACMGSTPSIRTGVDWVLAGAVSGNKPKLVEGEFFAIWAKPDGSVIRFTSELVDQGNHAPFCCLSCHNGFTLGALYAGASAEQAVRLTLDYTDAGGGDVQVESLAPVLVVRSGNPNAGEVFKCVDCARLTRDRRCFRCGSKRLVAIDG